MDRQTNRFALVGERSLDRLLDPPSGVRAELSSLGRVKALDRLDQTDVSFADQVDQRQTEIAVIVRDLHHEPQIRLNHQVARLLVALLNARRQLNLLFRSDQRNLTNILQIQAN